MVRFRLLLIGLNKINCPGLELQFLLLNPFILLFLFVPLLLCKDIPKNCITFVMHIIERIEYNVPGPAYI